MKKLHKLLFAITLLLTPTIVLATDGSEYLTFFFVFIVEMIFSFSNALAVFKLIAKKISANHEKEIIMALFIIRICILLVLCMKYTIGMCAADFIIFLVGYFVISAFDTLDSLNKTTVPIEQSDESKEESIELKCSACNSIIKETDKFCLNCGLQFNENNVIVTKNTNESSENQNRVILTPANFDPMYMYSEEVIVRNFIYNEIRKSGIGFSDKLITIEELKRKNILSIIFSILLFVYVSSIFFHFPIITYIFGFILLVIFLVKLKKFDFMKYMVKQVKDRPGEKISNIVMSIEPSLVIDTSKKNLLISLPIIIVLTFTLFWKPRILYENTNDGVAVRYYIFGISNYSSVTIPESYNGKKVVSLRGNTFSNMFLLKHVNLPDTIKEIRGQAFKNDRLIEEVKLPSKLEYLGGGAFYNCTSLKSIELPNSLTHLGGSTFYNCTSLVEIQLSKSLSEIRGNTFEKCTSLKSISIPDSVSRIGGHAFYSCTSLSEVLISQKSNLEEIGSSAFRLCTSLESITIPESTIVNERAFKESPTNIYRCAYSNEEDE